MSRQALIIPEDLPKYRQEPNLFYRAFETQYYKMFRPTESLINHQKLGDWYFEVVDTIKDLIKFVTSSPGDVSRLCILRGWTGGGKTTSVRALFEKMQERLPKNIVYIYIHSAVLGPKTKDLEKDFNKEVYRHLRIMFPDNYFRDVSSEDRTDDANVKRLTQLVGEGKIIVAVWDNVDQCAREVQMDCLRLAYRKLYWIKRLKLIVPVREYNFNRARTELPIATYSTFPVPQLPVPIEQVLKIREGLSQKSIQELGSDSKTIDLGEGIQVTVGHGRRFLARMISDLCQPDISRALSSLSNTNMNVQLDMAHYALKTPYITRRAAMDTIRRYFERDEHEILLPYHRFIEGLLVGSPTTCYSVFSFGDSHLINIFDAGDIDAYYNTLNRLHLSVIVSRMDAGIKIETILKDLETLGHDTGCTSASISEFLKCGMVWSEEGSAEDFPKLITTIKPNKATHYYNRILVSKLIYLQHMGLVTPIEDEYRENIRHWTMEDESSSFVDRMTSVKALLQQIAVDEEEEINFAKKSTAALTILKRYKFGNISRELAKHVLTELEAIKKCSDTLPIPENDWQDMIGRFDQIANRNPSI